MESPLREHRRRTRFTADILFQSGDTSLVVEKARGITARKSWVDKNGQKIPGTGEVGLITFNKDAGALISNAPGRSALESNRRGGTHPILEEGAK
jgi:hypothetical protein